MNIFPFVYGLYRIMKSFSDLYDTEISLQFNTVSEMYLLFYPTNGIYFKFGFSSIIVQDASTNMNIDLIPFFKDYPMQEKTVPGVKSLVCDTLKGAIPLGEHFIVPADQSMQLLETVHLVVDMSQTIKLTEAYFNKLNAEKVSCNTLRIMGSWGPNAGNHKKLGFFASLTDPWSTGNLNSITNFSNQFLKLVLKFNIGLQQ